MVSNPKIGRDYYYLFMDEYVAKARITETNELFLKSRLMGNAAGHYNEDSLDILVRHYNPESLFNTPEEAFNVYMKRQEVWKNEYRGEINSIEDLLEFPLKHCLTGNDIDFNALTVYEEKKKEYLETLKDESKDEMELD